MKYYIIIFLALLHLSYILLNSVNNTITAYFDFYEIKNKDEGVHSILSNYSNAFSKLNSKHPIQLYAMSSGAETGYGFFAPNVLSSGDLVFEYKKKKIAPVINSYEGKMRFTSVISSFISHIVTPESEKDTSDIDNKILALSMKVKMKKVYEIEDQYYDLVLKNIAAKVYADHSCQDTLKASLFIYSYPSLSAYRINKNMKPAFIRIKQSYFFKK